MNRQPDPALRLDRILELAIRAARLPSALILGGFRNPGLSVERKADGSPVTALDREAVVEFTLNRWDLAATEVLVEEAGGRFFTRPSRTTPGKFDTVFGSAYAAEEVVELLDFRPE